MNKMEGLVSSDRKLKEYIKSKSLDDVRGIFIARSQLVEGVKDNNTNLYRGKVMKWDGYMMEVDIQ